MKKTWISRSLRERVSKQARYRCGYCLTPQRIIGMPMEIEHIIPESAGGPTREENLWLACRRCNRYKGIQTHAIEPKTRRRVSLFNPRTQAWKRHFAWSDDGIRILGRTAKSNARLRLSATGRATVAALCLNNEIIMDARRLWVQAGWHPPKD